MKKVFIAICLLLIFIFAISFGIFIFNKENKKDKGNISYKNNAENIINITEENEVEETISEEVKISQNANLIINKYYKDCEHTVTSSVDIPYDMVNLTEEELKEKYADWEILDFSSKEISLYKEFDGICNEHYEVSIKNGYIAVYNLNDKDEKSLYEMTEISTKFLPEGDVSDLRKGIEITGEKELNAFLEDYE